MADIKFDCPECKSLLTVDEAGVGMTLTCPQCSKSIRVPNNEAKIDTNTEERIKKLEAEVAKLVNLTAKLSVDTLEKKEVRAGSFIVVDKNGKERAGLSADDDDGHPVFLMLDENGKGRASLTVGTDNGPLLSMLDENNKIRACLFLSEGGAVLSMNDENGKFRVSMNMDEDGPKLRMFDENGIQIWDAP